MSASEPAIRTDGITRRFGPIVALDHIDLEVPAGGVIGLVGPNGSGKSTLIRILLGLVRPMSGTAQVLGRPITNPTAYADRIGALIDSPAFVPVISARKNLTSLAVLRGISSKRVDEVLDIVDLSDRAHNQVKEYSLGMRQRLGIAAALLPDPDLLILDEPTNGLDPEGIAEIRTLMRRLGNEGRTVIVSSHLLSELEAIADYVVVIRFGRLLYSGPLAALMHRAKAAVEVEPERPADVSRLAEVYRRHDWSVEEVGGVLRVHIDTEHSPDLDRAAHDASIVLRRLAPQTESLEQIFLEMTAAAEPTDRDVRKAA